MQVLREEAARREAELEKQKAAQQAALAAKEAELAALVCGRLKEWLSSEFLGRTTKKRTRG